MEMLSTANACLVLYKHRPSFGYEKDIHCLLKYMQSLAKLYASQLLNGRPDLAGVNQLKASAQVHLAEVKIGSLSEPRDIKRAPRGLQSVQTFLEHVGP